MHQNLKKTFSETVDFVFVFSYSAVRLIILKFVMRTINEKDTTTKKKAKQNWCLKW